MMSNFQIVVCDSKETVLAQYESSHVPRKGELVNLVNLGTFRIHNVVYKLSDGQWLLSETLICVELIIDPNHPITDFGENNQGE